MQARANLRRVLPALTRTAIAPSTPRPTQAAAQRRTLCTDAPKDGNPILRRLLAPNSSGRNTLLQALGYYGAESRAIGAGNALYEQALSRATAAAHAESDASFAPRFEMLSVHVYLTLRRLRMEKGSAFEAEIKTVMQCLFDVFWNDVRMRMMIKEEGMKLIASGRLIKECEQRFFGMALAFDEAWDNVEKFDAAIGRNVTCLRSATDRIVAFRRYMIRERDRLEKMPVQEIWDGVYWDDRYPSPQSA